MQEWTLGRLIRSKVVILGLLWCATRPASAHSSAHGAGSGVDALLVITIVAGISAATGFAAVVLRGRIESPVGAVRGRRLVGALFVGIGSTAAGSVVLERTVAGLVAGGSGVLLGAALVTCRACGTHSKAAIGSITVHRFIEGTALAALSIAGRTVGILGMIVLTVHAAVECLSIGIHPDITRGQAVGSVSVVTLGFASGFGVGTLSFTASGAVWTELVIAAVGGLMCALGVSESQPGMVGWLQHRSRLLVGRVRSEL